MLVFVLLRRSGRKKGEDTRRTGLARLGGQDGRKERRHVRRERGWLAVTVVKLFSAVKS